MMEPISVIVHGALGKMGTEILRAVNKDSGLKLVGAVDIKANSNSITLDSKRIPLYRDIGSMLQHKRPQVLIDFSVADASIQVIRLSAGANINLVIGTTGFSSKDIKEFQQLAKKNNIGIILSPNFALGAVILMYLAGIAARHFDNAEIVELHNDEKADAPSGTALATANKMLEARGGKPFKYPVTKKETITNSRGGQLAGIAIHSVRLPGFVASEEIIFGMQGQSLKLRHDAINRECYMPGIILATKEVMKYRGSMHSLEDLLQLGGKNEGL